MGKLVGLGGAIALADFTYAGWECPNCGPRFKISALWVHGWCQHCFMRFGQMSNFQKSIILDNILCRYINISNLFSVKI
ncbi:MAG: hypothetical protein EAZ90_26055 [Oscillatoriales cyanobacterium]|nr:MAG: hypothetical protein EAZ94_14380 [Oscillatoriales cyanobacterium]TAE37711.1 MAG: hypothetical protein EAZ90_26055 [Oscillatoriales cyanobacterium]TAF89131.1 MAG: hypothetical protein EAZ49_14005 [Oscillatoriales cyanobacterium]TAG04074.1 MAG: hypothetical protein EAZ45_08640 [Oscillatoriales cyanobacterium]TAG60321.1 MAG: hypothetical protein EAZ28_08035 [Oscillatoriales cyanobacterium]